MVDQISVNFVGDDKDIVFDANPAKFDQLISSPYAPHRVVWAAQYSHLDLRIFAFRFKIPEVHAIATILKDQNIGDHLGMVILNGSIEGVINGWLDEHLIPLRGECANQHIQSRDNSWGETDPLRVNFPAMSPLHPINHRLVESAGWCRVSIDPVFGPGN